MTISHCQQLRIPMHGKSTDNHAGDDLLHVLARTVPIHCTHTPVVCPFVLQKRVPSSIILPQTPHAAHPQLLRLHSLLCVRIDDNDRINHNVGT